jgi:hypothetical protein
MAARSTACAAGWVHASRPDRRPPREFLCNLIITEFLTKDPVQTFAPIRRAGP